MNDKRARFVDELVMLDRALLAKRVWKKAWDVSCLRRKQSTGPRDTWFPGFHPSPKWIALRLAEDRLLAKYYALGGDKLIEECYALGTE